MLELKLPETGTSLSSYICNDFHYELLLNLDYVRLTKCSGNIIRFSMNLINPNNPLCLDDAWEYLSPINILQEEEYKRAEAEHWGGTVIDHYVLKQLAELVGSSVRKEGGKLLLSGSENRANSYYAHREIYVLPGIFGVEIVDVRAQTHPGRSVKAFCSAEIDPARKEKIQNRTLSHFVKCLSSD